MGDVTLTINDNQLGTVTVSQSSVQVVIGCCSAGTANTLVVTKDPNVLVTNCGYGKGIEAAALAAVAGATVIFIKVPTASAGTATSVSAFATGTSVVTLTLDGTNGAFDDYQVKFLVVNGGTRGTTGITFQLSLDAGRTYGPVISLGTATTYAIPNTGITLNFGVGTMVAGEFVRFSTTAMTWNTSGVQAALQALQNSAYAQTGWGAGIHIVGVCSGANASTIQGYLDTLATGFIYSFALVEVTDVTMQTAWGGAGGQTESQWMTAIQTDYAAVSAKRTVACAAHWNMPSVISNTSAGTPRYRRNIAFAAAARQATITPQRSSGRVRDGSLSQIVVDPTNDPTDGFVYHDEQANPGLEASRFLTTIVRIGLQGVYVKSPMMMSPSGSDFNILPRRAVMDLACAISHTVGQLYVQDDVRLKANGTIDERDAMGIEQTVQAALKSGLTANGYISASSVLVNRSINMASTSNLQFAVTITGRGYILTENITIGFLNPNAA